MTLNILFERQEASLQRADYLADRPVRRVGGIGETVSDTSWVVVVMEESARNGIPLPRLACLKAKHNL